MSLEKVFQKIKKGDHNMDVLKKTIEFVKRENLGYCEEAPIVYDFILNDERTSNEDKICILRKKARFLNAIGNRKETINCLEERDKTYYLQFKNLLHK